MLNSTRQDDIEAQLIIAAFEGSLEQVQRMIGHGAAVNIDPDGMPLHWASRTTMSI